MLKVQVRRTRLLADRRLRLLGGLGRDDADRGSGEDKKYLTLSVPEGTTIDGMLKDAVGRHGLEFPLADFLSEAPSKAFLTGVTSGRVANSVTPEIAQLRLARRRRVELEEAGRFAEQNCLAPRPLD